MGKLKMQYGASPKLPLYSSAAMGGRSINRPVNTVATGSNRTPTISADTLYQSLRDDIRQVDRRLSDSQGDLEKRINQKLDALVEKRKWIWSTGLTVIIGVGSIIMSILTYNAMLPK